MEHQTWEDTLKGRENVKIEKSFWEEIVDVESQEEKLPIHLVAIIHHVEG